MCLGKEQCEMFSSKDLMLVGIPAESILNRYLL